MKFSNAPVGHPIELRGYVEIVDAITISDTEQLDAVTSKVIWSDEYATSRMQWKRRDPLWVLIVRAYRLVEPITVAWSDDYKGCTSWVDLNDVPDDLAAVESVPAISDDVFNVRANSVREAIRSG